MYVRDIMTKDLVIANTDDTVLDIARLMAHHNIGCIPIVEKGQKVLGIITDRDIVLSMAKYNKSLGQTLVSDIMTKNVYSVKPEAEVEQALMLMKRQQIRRLPVIDNDILVGMVSLGDFAVYDDKDKYEISDALTEISRPARAENI